jgi:hypothetical protein
MCQEFIEFTPSETTDVQCNILTSENSMVEFEVNIPGIFTKETDSFRRVEIKDHSRMKMAGSPEVPVLSFLVAIPVCDDVNIAVEILDSVKIGGINIYPAPEMVKDSTSDGDIFIREEFYYDETAYNTNGDFPGIFSEILNRGALREQQCVRVFLYPVQFNPVLKEINAFPWMKVTLSFENPSGPINENVGIFNEMAGNAMINYVSNGLNASVNCGMGLSDADPSWVWALPNQKIDQSCDYLIITPLDFWLDLDARAAINALAEHRENFNGFDVRIITTSVIQEYMSGSILYIQIRDLIKNTYNYGIANNTYDGKLAYVNLFSDVNLESGNPGAIPTWSNGYDIFYTQLTIPPGETDPDPYPDIMIGRCSADNAEQVQNVVNKILNFHPQEMIGNNNILTVLGNDDQYFSLYSNVLENMDNILQDNYSKRLMAPINFINGNYFDPGWQLTGYNQYAIPNIWATTGLMFVNYMGHGTQLAWTIENWNWSFNYSDLNLQDHINKIPFMVSTACLTGVFNHQTTYEDCMGERFLCYNENMGGIGFYGATEPTSPYSFHLCGFYYDAMFNNYSYVLGENMMEVKVDQYDDAWFTYDDITINWCEDYNLLGDPAVNILYENIESMLPDLTIGEFYKLNYCHSDKYEYICQ